MIFRRIADAIGQQNWMTVALEFLIVVGGIFVGLQVDSWNQSRQDRDEEQVYLGRLLVDMEASLTLQDEQIARVEEHIRSHDFIIAVLKEKSLEDGDRPAFESALNRFGASARPLTITSTIDELKATGKILLIQDTDIRSSIGALQASLDLAKDIQQNAQRIQASATPLYVKVGSSIAAPNSPWTRSIEYDFQTMDRAAAISAFSVASFSLKEVRRALFQHRAVTEELRIRLTDALS